MQIVSCCCDWDKHCDATIKCKDFSERQKWQQLKIGMQHRNQRFMKDIFVTCNDIHCNSSNNVGVGVYDKESELEFRKEYNSLWILCAAHRTYDELIT